MGESRSVPHFLGPIFGVPRLLGWVRSWVRGGAILFFWVTWGFSHRVWVGRRLGPGERLSSPCEHAQGVHGRPWGWGRGGHRQHRRVWYCLHPDNARPSPVDTAHGAHLHAPLLRAVDLGADDGVIDPPPPRVGRGICLGGEGGLCGRGGIAWGFLFLGWGLAPFDESSDSKCIVEIFLPPLLVVGSSGDGCLVFVGGGSLFLRLFLTPPSQSPPCIPVHAPSSSALEYHLLIFRPFSYCTSVNIWLFDKWREINIISQYYRRKNKTDAAKIDHFPSCFLQGH